MGDNSFIPQDKDSCGCGPRFAATLLGLSKGPVSGIQEDRKQNWGRVVCDRLCQIVEQIKGPCRILEGEIVVQVEESKGVLEFGRQAPLVSGRSKCALAFP